MRRLAGIIVLFGFLGFVPLKAKAHPLLDDAIASYERADFSAALQTFDAAARNADLSVEELLQLFEMRALVHHALGNRAGMLEDLRRLAAVRPSYQLSRLAPPPVRKAFSDMLEANGGTLGVELIIRERDVDGTRYIVALVEQAPSGLVDHVGIQCRVGLDDKTIARTAQGTKVELQLTASGRHNGCDATAHTRQGGVLFSANVGATAGGRGRDVFQTPRYEARSDRAGKKRKKWPWIVAAAAVAVAGGVTAGVLLSRRSDDGNSEPGGVTVNW